MKNFLTSTALPPLKGHEVPETIGGNLEKAHWKPSSSLCQEIPPFLPVVPWPSSFSLFVRLVPNPPSSQALVNQTRGLLSFSPVPLYNHEAVSLMDLQTQEFSENTWQSLSFTYEKWASKRPASFSLKLNREDVIYTHSFQTQRKNITQKIEITSEGWVSSPLEEKNTRALYQYGGFYKIGFPLETSEQLYYYITDKENKTQVAIRPSSFWEKKGIPAPTGGVWEKTRFVFMGSQKTPLSTKKARRLPVAHSLRKGGAQVTLHKIPSPQERLSPDQSTCLYRSFDFEKVKEEINLFILHFIRA